MFFRLILSIAAISSTAYAGTGMPKKFAFVSDPAAPAIQAALTEIRVDKLKPGKCLDNRLLYATYEDGTPLLSFGAHSYKMVDLYFSFVSGSGCNFPSFEKLTQIAFSFKSVDAPDYGINLTVQCSFSFENCSRSEISGYKVTPYSGSLIERY
jgi:hypothetical protein